MDFGTSQLSPVTMSGLESHSMEFEAMMRLFSEALTCGRFSIRTMQAGESAGYGRVFQAEQETKLAVVTIGYADGLPRDLPQRGGQVLIQGRRCPMVGWMCMDQLLVDVSDLSEVAPGDTVTIIGRDGGQVIRAEELAACCGTITNELLSRLGMRLPIVSG